MSAVFLIINILLSLYQILTFLPTYAIIIHKGLLLHVACTFYIKVVSMKKNNIDVNGIAFSEKCSGHIGSLLINGLVLPRTNSFDPLVKIWTSVRKRIFEKAGLDVVGIFAHDVEQELIVCSFYLVYGDEVIDIEDHTRKFEKSFHKQMALFEDTLLKFLESDVGYETYVKVLEADTEAIFANVLNEFLKSIGSRTKADERRSREKDARIAEASRKTESKKAEKAEKVETAENAKKTKKTKK